jgi:hypothetical protein
MTLTVPPCLVPDHEIRCLGFHHDQGEIPDPSIARYIHLALASAVYDSLVGILQPDLEENPSLDHLRWLRALVAASYHWALKHLALVHVRSQARRLAHDWDLS